MTIARLSQPRALQYSDGAYRAEIRAWTTDDPKRMDGVPAGRAALRRRHRRRDPDPRFDSTGAGWLPTDTRSSHDQCLLLLGTNGDHPDLWLHAARLSNTWLEIARQGFVMSPLTQVVEVPAVRSELREELRHDDVSAHPHARRPRRADCEPDAATLPTC